MDRTDPGRSRRRRREEPIDQVMQVGRQLVDGVSGARPGRSRARGEGLSRVGRWMEERLDWFLEDEDDWQEPWQRSRPEDPAAPAPPRESGAPAPPGRRPLEAISRRSLRPAGPAEADTRQQDWPDDSAFRVSRWQRPDDSGSSRPAGRRPAPAEAARPMPRSSRRRGGA
jgi:hypothetical protein